MFVVKVNKGEEVLATITREIETRGVTSASITLIGAVQTYCLSVMPKGDPLNDILTEYDQPAELAGTGEVVDGKPHIHVSLGAEDSTIAGHLHWAKVQDWFVRAYITPLD